MIVKIVAERMDEIYCVIFGFLMSVAREKY